MTAPVLTYAYAHSAAWDAGNRSMRAAGRDRWNDDDYSAAARAFDALQAAADVCDALTHFAAGTLPAAPTAMEG